MAETGLLHNRFELAEELGSGAMGRVYLATDAHTGKQVAVKILHDSSIVNLGRFVVEAAVLSKLSHPSIVRYIAHGSTRSSHPFLVMEWLSGETLEERLTKGMLSPQQTLTLGSKVASALAAAHRAGIVHRDIKPSNLFLVDRSIDQVKLTDFGIARRLGDELRLTQTGMLIGTPVYMSPEQARGGRDIGPAADVWALGCVLYECLAGAAPFTGDSLLEVLGKIILESPIPLVDRCPGIEGQLAESFEGLLAKEIRLRPEAAVIAEQWSRFLADGTRGQVFGSTVRKANLVPREARATGGVVKREQRVVCLLLLSPPRAFGGDDDIPVEWGPPASELDGVLREYGAQIETVLDGSRFISWSSRLAPREQVIRAARCARALQLLFTDTRMVLCTGRAVIDNQLALGDLLQRGSQMLETAPYGEVRVDATSSALLRGRFALRPTGDDLELLDELDEYETMATLLGRETSCVGRDRDIDLLLGMFSDCEEEGSCRAVLLTGPAGIGKTRLVREVLKRIRLRGQTFELLLARGDSLTSGSPFSLLAPAIRRAAEIYRSDSEEVQRTKLIARVAKSMGPAADKVVPFLGEMIGVRFPDEELPELRSSREDARVMADQMLAAWLDWLEHEAAHGVLVLVMEDLHWGDTPSMQFIDATLSRLEQHRLFLIAAARPEVDDLFPGLFRDRNVSALHLSPLAAKAAEQLVTQILGDSLAREERQSLVRRADGNPLFLEEFIRFSQVSPREATLPDSVLGMVQARLDTLGEGPKRAAAILSVFGQSCSRQAAEQILSQEQGVTHVSECLAVLVQKEILAHSLRLDEQFSFRHGLIRDCAYDLLTREDQRWAHARAATLLARQSDAPARAVAEHFEKGGNEAEAADWYRRAAEQALLGDDLKGVIACADRALACGAEGDVLGDLAWFKAEAHQWGDENQEALRWSQEARKWLRTGGSRWIRATAVLIIAYSRLSQVIPAEEESTQLVPILMREPIDGPIAASISLAILQLSAISMQSARQLHEALQQRRSRFERDALGDGWFWLAEGSVRRAEGDPYTAYTASQKAAETLAHAGDLRGECAALAVEVSALLELGAVARAEALIEDALAKASRIGLRGVVTQLHFSRCIVLALRGNTSEAIGALRTLLLGSHEITFEVYARSALLELEISQSNRAEAEALAQQLYDGLTYVLGSRHLLARTEAAYALWLLHAERHAQALQYSSEAFQILGSELGLDGEWFVRRAHSEVLLACGKMHELTVALQDSHERLARYALQIQEAELRSSFLAASPDVARLIALRQAHVGAALPLG